MDSQGSAASWSTGSRTPGLSTNGKGHQDVRTIRTLALVHFMRGGGSVYVFAEKNQNNVEKVGLCQTGAGIVANTTVQYCIADSFSTTDPQQ